MNDENGQGRTVRCTIEMDLVEGEHFRAGSSTDNNAMHLAKRSFVDMLSTMQDGDVSLEEYVQCRVIG